MENFDPCLIFQEVGRYNFKINVIPSFSIELDKIISIDCGNPLVLIDSLRFLNGSLDNLFNFFLKNDYHCISQEFNANVSDLV